MGGAAERDEVLARLLASHETWFDVYRDYEFAGRTFPGYAEFHSHAEQYVLVKRAKLWEVDAFEYLFFESVEELDEEDLDRLVTFITTEGLKKVRPDPNHMTSYLSLIVIAEQATPTAKKKARKTRFRKNFALGVRGWADLRLAIIDLSDHSIAVNSQGKAMRPTLVANLASPNAAGYEM